MHTLSLIEKAKATGTPLTTVATALGVNANALHSAQRNGRLSPGLAAALAAHLGENVASWTLQAVIESERSAPLRRKLTAIARSANSYLSALARRGLKAASPRRVRPCRTVPG